MPNVSAWSYWLHSSKLQAHRCSIDDVGEDVVTAIADPDALSASAMVRNHGPMSVDAIAASPHMVL
jgi:hypothetical protein